MEDKSIQYKEVLEVIKRVRPEWEMSHGDPCHEQCGEGFVEASVFTFFEYCYLWITFLCEHNIFAYKVVSCEWIETYSGLILESPIIFVEYDKHHRICGWSTAQKKQCNICKK